MNEEETLETRLSIRCPITCGSPDALRSGCYCPKGWESVVENLAVKIEAIVTADPALHGFRVDQIKEKFGGLRFYVNQVHAEIDALIAEAEDISMKTCEACSLLASGAYPKRGWVRTLCEDCYAK